MRDSADEALRNIEDLEEILRDCVAFFEGIAKYAELNARTIRVALGDADTA